MRWSLILFLVFIIHKGMSQDNTDLKLGIGITLTAEIQNAYHFKFRASAAGGVGPYLKINDHGFGVLPTVHFGLMLYNRGILGSQLSTTYDKSVFLDVFTNFTMTIGGKTITNKNRLEERYVPLYHFSDFTANPLQNTFKHSVSLGSNIILNPDKHRGSQVVGFFNLNIARTVQISYYNDGGPILKYLGDKKDRYYTGGLVVSAHFNRNTAFHLVALSFHKFTGWQKYAFDVSDKLQLDHIPYIEEAVFGFNQQQWTLSVTNFTKNYSGYLSAYDVDVWDIQDLLHFGRDSPYHPDYFYSYRIAGGISYHAFNTGF